MFPIASVLHIDPDVITAAQRQKLAEAIQAYFKPPSDLKDHIFNAALMVIMMARRPASSSPVHIRQDLQKIRDACATAHNALAFSGFAALNKLWNAVDKSPMPDYADREREKHKISIKPELLACFPALEKYATGELMIPKTIALQREPREIDELIDALGAYARASDELVKTLPTPGSGRHIGERKQRCVRACIDLVFEPFCPDEIKVSSQTLKGFADVIWEIANPGTKLGMRRATEAVFKDRKSRQAK